MNIALLSVRLRIDLLGTLGGVAALPGAAKERELVEQAAHSTVTGLLPEHTKSTPL
jgi:hypothetical protein